MLKEKDDIVKHVTKGRDSLENLLFITIEDSAEVKAVFNRGQLKRFFYTDKKGYNHKWDFYEKRDGYQVTNPWVYRMIRSELIQYKENIKYNPKAKSFKGYRHNRELINSLSAGQVVYQTDMSHCYLQIAKKLAYIGEDSYNKMVKKYDTAKTDICIAFTTAFTEEIVEIYRDGKRVEKKDTTIYELEHTLENICYEVFTHVNFLYEKFSEICLGYVVDAVYSIEIEPVREYFEAAGIECKTVEYEWWGDGTVFNEKEGIKKIF